MEQKKPKMSGKNANDLLRENQSLVVKKMMRHKHCSRSELAQMTGLTQAAITKIVSGLMELGIIEEIGIEKSGRGRSRIMLTLKGDNLRIISIKLARTSFSTAVFDITGEMHTSDYFVIGPGKKPQQIIDEMLLKIQEYLQRFENVFAVGAAVPGPYLRHEGRISQMTEFAGWENFNINEALSSQMSIPVFVEHDANAGALAEWWFGEKSPDSLVFLLASEGIGAGIINQGGRLLLGHDGVAGEIGHMSIDLNGRKCHCAPNRRGCLEQYSSSLSFERDVLYELPAHPESSLYLHLKEHKITAMEVFCAAEEGDAFAQKMVDTVAYYLGTGVANIVSIYNPHTIVISDIMALGGKRLLDGVRKAAQEQVFPGLYDHLNIRFSHLPCDPILLGAMTTAANRFLDNPAALIQKNASR